MAGSLFALIDGATYRYTWTDPAPANVTADKRLYEFSEDAAVEGVAIDHYTICTVHN